MAHLGPKAQSASPSTTRRIHLRRTDNKSGELQKARLSVAGSQIISEPDQPLIQQLQRSARLCGGNSIRIGPISMNALERELAQGANIFNDRCRGGPTDLQKTGIALLRNDKGVTGTS